MISIISLGQSQSIDVSDKIIVSKCLIKKTKIISTPSKSLIILRNESIDTIEFGKSVYSGTKLNLIKIDSCEKVLWDLYYPAKYDCEGIDIINTNNNTNLLLLEFNDLINSKFKSFYKISQVDSIGNIKWEYTIDKTINNVESTLFILPNNQVGFVMSDLFEVVSNEYTRCHLLYILDIDSGNLVNIITLNQEVHNYMPVLVSYYNGSYISIFHSKLDDDKDYYGNIKFTFSTLNKSKKSYINIPISDSINPFQEVQFKGLSNNNNGTFNFLCLHHEFEEKNDIENITEIIQIPYFQNYLAKYQYIPEVYNSCAKLEFLLLNNEGDIIRRQLLYDSYSNNQYLLNYYIVKGRFNQYFVLLKFREKAIIINIDSEGNLQGSKELFIELFIHGIYYDNQRNSVNIYGSKKDKQNLYYHTYIKEINVNEIK